MRIYLLRHGDAVPEASGLGDASRYLSDDGRRSARSVAAALGRAGVALGAVVSSPLVRAVQTTEIVAAVIAPDLEVAIAEDLAPDGSVRVAAAHLAALPGDVLAVGHEPNISGLAAALTGRGDFPAFRKTQALAIEDRRVLWWLLPGDEKPRAWDR